MTNTPFIIKTVEKLGRVSIPKEIRERFNLLGKNHVEMSLEGDTIVLTKQTPGCFFCGIEANNATYRGKKICKECLGGLAKKSDDVRGK